MAFADHFSKQATDYTRYRPHYPPELFDYLVSLCPQYERALDVATGNGQAAVALGEHFAKVIGCEPSLAQLRNAQKQHTLEYLCSTAEQLPFPDETFDLISVAQAVHWFDHARFNAEAVRLLKPGGVLAIWGYGLFSIAPAIDALINDYYAHTLKGYWPEERHWIERSYADLPFPFAQLDTPAFHIQAQWTLPEVIGYLATWSATQRYLADYNHNPLPALEQRLAEHWPDPSQPKPIQWPIHLLAGRKQEGRGTSNE
ncbi:class I SAM-dependent methyltransferase [Thiohalophilus sp.]|uniref:class I SAM-dependent methyltransferase n=1 Tax=Thiohalophilus sp. TaxID=3028392 RepID=UPI002ACEC6B1|nr:class I SAM-dependent methyltransferase [Thiohalophilus sp.]MDZ7804781.1 class I SAM-dependent methyltransferase [Thiohalophilus sp.]